MKKIMNGLKCMSIFLLCSNLSFSQEKGQRIFLGNLSEIYFQKYPSNFQIKANLKNKSEAKNSYPEELMMSIISCSDTIWEAYHTFGGRVNADIKSDKHYTYIKKMSKEKNYFELKDKLEFKIDDTPTAIVKFHFHAEQVPQPVAGVVTMQKYNGKWYKVSMKMFSKLAMIALRIKSETLEKIINGSTEDQFLKDIQSKIKTDNKLDFDKLSFEIDSWYSDESEKNKEKKLYFKDPNSVF